MMPPRTGIGTVMFNCVRLHVIRLKFLYPMKMYTTAGFHTEGFGGK